MPVNTYETMLLLDPTKVSTDSEGVLKHLHALWERHEAKILVSRPWDYNHKLAYPIRKFKKGAYHVIYYQQDSQKQRELDRDIKLQEGLVLRHLTIRLHPKWVDAMLNVAREDHSTAFALRGMREDVPLAEDVPPSATPDSGAAEAPPASTPTPAPTPAPTRRSRRSAEGADKSE
ncbi:MAG: 30S ribosomal protein S6 [Thermogemmata sp.]|uniref:Small ribosomal subunit protein bS6 n=1 Tax=Thermogemmata fonticola TaxID=2755323 RepID=A0A7V8VDZ7_9BACT|nr:30S ribosomal protein S6 [Thermogemmata fonticola]MBA2226290.1 30S ribosomal protein S6 [Thermogemmata fonticola]MCX8141090.1 30S ribosomal protein S6 [Gemmataceae bacterium]